MPRGYTEDTLVQETTAEYLKNQLGWESVYAFNNEDFGPSSLLGRLSKREVVLTRYLRRALADLNPGLPDEAYDHAVRQLAETATTQSMVVTNRELYNLVRDGVRVRYTNDQGERKAKRLKVIDFAEPTKNHFLCVRELWVHGPSIIDGPISSAS